MSPGVQEESVYGAFRQRAKSHPDHEFIVHRGIRLTYGECLVLADRIAGALLGAGVTQGARVAIVCSTRPEVAIVFLACAKVGAIYVGLGTRLRGPDFEHVLKDCMPTVTFSPTTLDGVDYGSVIAKLSEDLGLRAPVLLSDLREDALDAGLLTFSQSGLADEDAPSIARTDDGLAIVYTSGTTGPPKGALLSHRYMFTFRGVFRAHRVAKPRLMSHMPVDHIGFLGNELMAAIATSGTMIQLPRFVATEAADVIERERVTVWQGAIPTMLTRLVGLEDISSRDLSSLEWVWWAGQLSERVAAAVQAIAGAISSSYGMTEASSIAITDPADPIEVHMRTVGLPLDDIEVRVSSEAGDEPGLGEIQLRRTGLMLGYWRQPRATHQAYTEDGWLRTGDLGHFDETGNLLVTGRRKLLIRSGGYNLSPFEIENVLQEHPAVALAVVFPLPDPEYGEAAHVALIGAPGASLAEDELRGWARDRLSGFKVPKKFHLVDQLPLLASGKPDRLAIRAQLSGSGPGSHG